MTYSAAWAAGSGAEMPVPRWPGAGESDWQVLQQIIVMAKPAHTVAELRWAEPRMRVNIQAFVGVDTVIGKYPTGVITDQGALGYDTVLGSPADCEPQPRMLVGSESRIGSTTLLN